MENKSRSLCVLETILTFVLTFFFQVEGDWQEMVRSLSVVPSLQPLLVQRLVKNGCKESLALKACLHTLRDERVLDMEEAKTNKQKCQVWNYQLIIS